MRRTDEAAKGSKPAKLSDTSLTVEFRSPAGMSDAEVRKRCIGALGKIREMLTEVEAAKSEPKAPRFHLTIKVTEEEAKKRVAVALTEVLPKPGSARRARGRSVRLR